MQQHPYTYESALAASQKVMWRIEDVIGGEKRRGRFAGELATVGRLFARVRVVH